MKVLGDATALATGTTKFKTSTAVYIGNTSASDDYDVTLRNTDDDADLGSITVPAAGSLVIHLDIGQGLRGNAALKGTKVNADART
jgi:hypothetical protein